MQKKADGCGWIDGGNVLEDEGFRGTFDGVQEGGVVECGGRDGSWCTRVLGVFQTGLLTQVSPSGPSPSLSQPQAPPRPTH